ncbi:MAG: tRNA (guanosine(37)-N1)-methyltransferase TrmD [Akkermansia sp.]|nr:tRNA (guanosine(37)-N1)-methyltransferase TrmD [Akkermansia sp.]
MLEIDVLTLFPELITVPLSQSIMGRAAENGLITVRAHQLRDWTHDKYRRTDDYLCGGGQGMLMKCEPIFEAVEELRRENTRVILMTPQGRPFCQPMAEALAAPCREGGDAHYIILCGHYEGVDQRVIDTLVDEEISIGDYILTNGAIAAVVVVDAVARLLPGALGDERSSAEESFSDGLLEAPAYTKPNNFRGMEVPAVFLSGNHRAIAEWKLEHALERTKANRPDLYEKWAAAHPEYFSPKRKRVRQTAYKPRPQEGGET